MNNLKIIIIVTSFILSTTSNLFAGVTVANPTSTSTLSKIASSTSFTSATNNNVSTTSLNKSTSSVMDVSKLKDAVERDAKEFRLKVDTAAITALAGYTGTRQSREKTLMSLTANVSEAALDQSQTKTPDTWVYTSDVFDPDGGTGMILTKDTDGYSSSNNVFSSTAGAQRAWGSSYVNFKQKTIWAKIKTQVTYADGTSKIVSFTTNSGAITETPIVAEAAWGLRYHDTSYDEAFEGHGWDNDNPSMKDQVTGNIEGMSASNEDGMKRWYNHKGDIDSSYPSDKSAGDVYAYGKITVPTAGATALGIISFEGSSCTLSGNTCSDANFVAGLERYSNSVEVTAKKFK